MYNITKNTSMKPFTLWYFSWIRDKDKEGSEVGKAQNN